MMVMGNNQLMKTPVSSGVDGQYQLSSINGSSVYLSSDFGSSFVAKSAGNKGWRQAACSNDGLILLMASTAGSILSTDFGDTWSNLPTIGTLYSEAIACSGDGQYILAPTYNNYAHISTDYGVTFNAITSLGVKYWRYKAIVSVTGQYMIMKSDIGSTYYYSDNYGVDWVVRTTPLASINAGIGMSGNGQYHTIGNRGTYSNYYYSSDYGATWEQGVTPAYWYYFTISYTGQYQIAGTTGNNALISTDYGATFMSYTGLYRPTHVEVSASGQYMSQCRGDGNSLGIVTSDDYWATHNTVTALLDFNTLAMGKAM